MKKSLNLMVRSSFLLAASIVLAGCAASYDTVIKEHELSKVCCRSVSEFNYQKLKWGELYSHIIDNKSPAYKFDGGKSYFRAFELPKQKEPYHVLINSYALMEPSGGRYLFHPVAFTLDESFQVVRRIPDDAWFANQGKFKEISRAPFDWVLGMESPFDRLTGQLSMTSQNQHEKYLVIHTSDLLLNEQSLFARRFAYKFGYEKMPARHSPAGRVLVELVKPSDLHKHMLDELAEVYNKTKPGERYHGNGFTVSPPQSAGYWAKDLSEISTKKYRSEISEFDFIRIDGSRMARAFAESYYLGSGYTQNISETSLETAQKAALEEHKFHLDEVKLSASSELQISGATCRRIDLYGKRAETLYLPIKGYDIICIHPDWETISPPLMVRFGANYVFGLDDIEDSVDEESLSLPKELLDFINNVDMIKVNSHLGK